MKHAPRKRFGQHFLTDSSVLAAIADAVAPQPGDRLVEIGPGLGALTAFLLGRTERLEAIEIDRDLVARLRRRWPEPRLTVHEGDALAFDFSGFAAGVPIRLIGNLPYNISTPLLIRLLGCRDAIVDQHFMLQKEVVDRIVAPHGGSDYGRLAVMMQSFHEVERLFDVPPEAFDPPPRVESSVVRLRPRAVPLTGDVATLEGLLAVAFNQRRKMLRGTLMPWLRTEGLDPDDPVFGLSPTARPEQVPLEHWGRLADALRSVRDARRGRPAADAADAVTATPAG